MTLFFTSFVIPSGIKALSVVLGRFPRFQITSYPVKNVINNVSILITLSKYLNLVHLITFWLDIEHFDVDSIFTTGKQALHCTVILGRSFCFDEEIAEFSALSGVLVRQHGHPP